jgi:hypothetical protein
MGSLMLRLLNRILLLKDNIIDETISYKKFDILEEIYADIFKYYDYPDISPEMYKSPFEGIYINENIVGILKVLIVDLLNKTPEQAAEIIEKQKFISYKDTKDIIVYNNAQLYRKSTEHNVIMDDDILENIHEENKESYQSDRIFLHREPKIQNMIQFYIKKRNVTYDGTEEVDGVNDVKIFYLFSNNNQTAKCKHQYKLYENTLGLMKLVDSANI